MKFLSVLIFMLCSFPLYAQMQAIRIAKPKDGKWITCNERFSHDVNRIRNGLDESFTTMIEKCIALNLDNVAAIYNESARTVVETSGGNEYFCVSVLPGCHCKDLDCTLIEGQESE